MITQSEFAAAGLVPKATVLNTPRGSEVYVALDPSGRAVFVGLAAVLNDKTSGVWQTGLVTDTYTGTGYAKSLPAFTYKSGPLTGWYADQLTDSQRTILDRANVSGAVAAGAAAQSAQCASFQVAADATIARARGIYGRGAGVPEDRIIVSPGVTLAGLVYAAMAQANANARAAGCNEPYPMANGASTQAGMNFPPPDGTIFLESGDVPIGVPMNSATTPTRNEGPWPAGAHSAWVAPVGAWRAGQSAPPAFRFPSPQLWYGPSATPSAPPVPPAPGGTGGYYPGVSGEIPAGSSQLSGSDSSPTAIAPPAPSGGGSSAPPILGPLTEGPGPFQGLPPGLIPVATPPVVTNAEGGLDATTATTMQSPTIGALSRNPLVWLAAALALFLLARES